MPIIEQQRPPGLNGANHTQPNEFVVHFAPVNTPARTNASANSTANQANKSLIRRVAERIWETVKWIFKIAIGVGLFIFNSSFFAVGFIVGLIFNKQIQPAIDKINLVWKKQSIAVGVILAVGAFLALPVTLAGAASLYGAVIGSKLSSDAQEES